MTDVLCGSPELAEQAAQMIQDKAISAGFTLPCISHPRFEKAPNHRLQHVTTGREISITCHPTMTVNTVEAMAALVRIGAGIAVLPNLVVKEDLERGALVPVLPDFSAPSKPIYAVHPYRGTPPAAVSALISEIQSRLSFEIPNVIQL
jgi:DNA-binding transcriptional LysR family regulator